MEMSTGVSLLRTAQSLLTGRTIRGELFDDHLIQLKVVTGTLSAQKYQAEILESDVRSPLDSLDGQNRVLRDDIARPHCTRIIVEYKN